MEQGKGHGGGSAQAIVICTSPITGGTRDPREQELEGEGRLLGGGGARGRGRGSAFPEREQHRGGRSTPCALGVSGPEWLEGGVLGPPGNPWLPGGRHHLHIHSRVGSAHAEAGNA